MCRCVNVSILRQAQDKCANAMREFVTNEKTLV